MTGLFWAGEDITLLERSLKTDRLRLEADKIEDLTFIRDGRFVDVSNRSASRNNSKTSGIVKKTFHDFSGFSSKSEMITDDSNDTCSEDDFKIGNASKKKTVKSMTLKIPKDIFSKTARTAIGMGISTNQATALISSFLCNAGGDIENVTLSHSSTHRIFDTIIRNDARVLRANITSMVKTSGKPIIVHFDSKIIKDYTGSIDETKDRICVLIRHDNQSHLLGAPGLEHGSGEAQFAAIQNLLDSFDLGQFIHGVCFDTTASNTGYLKGACARLANFHGRPLLLLACRHHVGELHIKHFCNEVAVNKSVGPENQLFKSLKQNWHGIDANNERMLLKFNHQNVKGTWLEKQALLALKTCKDLIDKNKLRNSQTFEKRKDYCELAELVVMFLEEDQTVRYKIHKTGAISHARFMAKALYYMKFNLLLPKIRQVLFLSDEIVKEINRMAEYISLFWASWFLTCEFSDSAAFEDQRNYWQMCHYNAYEPAAEVVLKSWRNHMWYLDPSTVVLALACSNKDHYIEMEKMAKVLYSTQRSGIKNVGTVRTKTKILSDSSFLFNIDQPPGLESYISPDSWLIFDILGHTSEKCLWMKLPQIFWKEFSGYNEFQSFVKSVEVVNDSSERAVKLIQDNVERAKSEEKLQNLLQMKNTWKKPFKKTKNGYKESVTTPAPSLLAVS
ncbi:uncharacterized protein LOC136084580 [Hydra vulgaris]|uniref:Uncharacterized protein LOC136084580 n=1 Tax=Hydra vulgaris TaxID=6087 RepID=A0ABM4CGM7_HYDVU